MSQYDEHAHHVRRYGARELRARLLQAGFRIVMMTSFVSLLLPLMMASRFMRRAPRADYDVLAELRVGRVANFLLEAVLIATLGGAIGCLLELPINGLVTSTTNWVSFSEVAFAFRVTPALLLNGMVFAVVMGIVGGVLPARKAATQPVVDALREA